MKSNNLVWYRNYISSDVVESGHFHMYVENHKKLEANLRQVLQPPTGLKRPFSHPPLTFDPQIHHTVCDTGVSDTVIISNHQH